MAQRATTFPTFSTVEAGRFKDRQAAGLELAEALSDYRGEDTVVVGLPRGGVPVAYEIAEALGVPLDVLVVRKLGAPMNPEFAIGAVGEGGVALVNRDELLRLGVGSAELDAIVSDARQDLERLVRRLRGDRAPATLAGKTVILVDDGIATGSTVQAAVHVLRERGVGEIVLAVPVSSPQAIQLLRGQVDDIVSLEVPRYLFSVGMHYRDFSAVSSDEVSELLARAGTTDGGTPDGVDDRHPLDGNGARSRQVVLQGDAVDLEGDLLVPAGARALILFAHGSGSSRLSPRNQQVAAALNRVGLGTLLFDLLTEREAADRSKVFDISLLAERLLAATRWVKNQPDLHDLAIGYFGASTGGAAALTAAAMSPDEVGAVVSRGGRPDLAESHLADVRAATLLIVGGNDAQVLELNEHAGRLLRCEHQLAVIPGATHLFEEPGALEAVAELASDWFAKHLVRAAQP